jgi:hypothetical protein
MMNAQSETVFTLTIDTQEMRVRYRPYHIGGSEPYAILEFISPHQPRREIPVSASGYRTFFAPMSEIEDAPNVEQYACMVALLLLQELSTASRKPAFASEARMS